jgi:hypothetical protein
MGEARRRKLAGLYTTGGVDPRSSPVAVQERVFHAVRGACAIWGNVPGEDCSAHAWATSAILEHLNIRHFLNFGAAIICFGPGPADCVTHCTMPDLRCRFEAGHFHAWVIAPFGNQIPVIDMTAYTLPDKARRLAALDGMPTTVAPDLPKWLWGQDLIYPGSGMADAKPGQMWCRADQEESDRRIAAGGADPAVMVLRRTAVDLFENPDAEVPTIVVMDSDAAGKFTMRQMNH